MKLYDIFYPEFMFLVGDMKVDTKIVKYIGDMNLEWKKFKL